MQALNAGGLGAVPLSFLGAVQRGEIDLAEIQRQAAQEEARAGSPVPTSSAARPASGGSTCPLRMPEVTLSPTVDDRIERFCERLARELDPFGNPGAGYDERAWADFWNLTFRDGRGIELGRRLLWLVKGIHKSRWGTLGTTVHFQGRRVDLLDTALFPDSLTVVREEVPVFGQDVFDAVTQAPQRAISSPFTSEETWSAIEKISRQLRGKTLDCHTAKGLDGDAFAAFHFLARGLDGWNHRVDLRGTPVDVVLLDVIARGGSSQEMARMANSGDPLGSADFYTTEDLRRTREERVVGGSLRPVFGASPWDGDGARRAAGDGGEFSVEFEGAEGDGRRSPMTPLPGPEPDGRGGEVRPRRPYLSDSPNEVGADSARPGYPPQLPQLYASGVRRVSLVGTGAIPLRSDIDRPSIAAMPVDRGESLRSILEGPQVEEFSLSAGIRYVEESSWDRDEASSPASGESGSGDGTKGNCCASCAGGGRCEGSEPWREETDEGWGT